jgi:hypothetical protein
MYIVYLLYFIIKKHSLAKQPKTTVNCLKRRRSHRFQWCPRNLTADIEPVQDNMHISHSENNNTIVHIEIRQTIQGPKDKRNQSDKQ